MREVFVPGGQPRHTYVVRDDLKLEAHLQAASDNLCKIVTVTGPTKCGKTVLTQKVYPKSKALWIDGGLIEEEQDLWGQVLDEMGGFTQVNESTSRGSGAEVAGEMSGQLGFPFLTKLGGKAGGKYSQQRETTSSRSRNAPSKAKAVKALANTRRPLVIDDFHYLAPNVQGNVVRALKALVFDGHAVILLAIPHRRYDAIRVEKEMTGRVEQIPIPPWRETALARIAELGFPALNITVPPGMVDRLVSECLGSPHLMQEFCRQLCEEVGIETTERVQRAIAPKDTIEALFARVARDTSKTIFERLAKGPRQRSDRKQRRFKDGSTGDIYVAVLQALAALKPGITTLEYEQVRSALRELLEELPQAHEVSSVLEHMSKIQADEAASAPVLDWDKQERRLHIIDPYFAFFLRWAAPGAAVS
jgi:hypothetical protein